jgi:two-component system, chemotaxis family, chemotaxis protein CheY
MIKKILIVDDSPVARKILKSCLPRDAAYEIFEATDGLTGLDAFKTNKPDITFMDITMPHMNGVECLAEIKKVSASAIVIMCTADIQVQSLEKAFSLGALTVVKKPPSKETIQQALSKVQALILQYNNA